MGKGRKERFWRSDRITSRPDFLAVQDRGRRVSGPSYLVLALTHPAAEQEKRTRLGITVSKKVGTAVVRNRVRRWVRESYRRVAAELAPPSTDIVVIARPSAVRGGYRQTAAELSGLLRRLGKR